MIQTQRQNELAALLGLLGELAASADSNQQQELLGLHKQLRLALPQLVSFSARLKAAQQAGAAVLGADGLGLLGWAWQRREALGYNNEELLSGLPAAWRNAARQVLAAGDDVARASSAVENWHSILRPQLAVHRALSSGLFSLLAVWHNHRRFARVKHAGQSPLQLSGMPQQEGDWLEVLGYPAALVPAASWGRPAAA